MKYIFYFFMAWGIWITVGYLFGAFCYFGLSLRAWSNDGRAFLAGWAFFGAIITGLLVLKGMDD
jgi:hypothetical protein